MAKTVGDFVLDRLDGSASWTSLEKISAVMQRR
jgi:hypothetical protein